ncbi:HAD family hydrolase [Aspergillus saccharolyticus JOP 1030-1]|uniref:HAD-like protein n=1 Tax=Aspergillus saccharolyticus JOP 1030-1 TaxID=1450539 RepID=A0A318ZMU8_9EURO|nr:HAD-like protein [Aspergillus saccharolyticus JOP 1030-1]PYH45743.1 HAD-like protein [Aspergillus saccharolyticus JOP 1030-1]
MHPKYNLIILDFDGTIFDSHAAIVTTMLRTFQHFLPDHPLPPTEELNHLIAQGQSPEVTFRALLQHHPAALAAFDELEWVRTFRALYAIHGQPLTQPYPGAMDLVRTLTQAHKIPVAIVSNKGFPALRAGLETHGFFAPDLIPEELVIGDGVFPGGKRKPDPAGFAEGLVPMLRGWFAARGAETHQTWLDAPEGVDMQKVLMVGDTMTDIRFARNIGCPVVWCRFGQGIHAECEAAGPEFVVDDLREFVAKVLGGDDQSYSVIEGDTSMTIQEISAMQLSGHGFYL